MTKGPCKNPSVGQAWLLADSNDIKEELEAIVVDAESGNSGYDNKLRHRHGE